MQPPGEAHHVGFGDELPVDLDVLPKILVMRAGVHRHALPVRLQGGGEQVAGGALAVDASNVNAAQFFVIITSPPLFLVTKSREVIAKTNPLDPTENVILKWLNLRRGRLDSCPTPRVKMSGVCSKSIQTVGD